MSNFTKFVLVILSILSILYIKDNFFKDVSFDFLKGSNINIPKLNVNLPKWDLDNAINGQPVDEKMKELDEKQENEKITDNTKPVEVDTQKEIKQIAKEENMKTNEMLIVYFIQAGKNGNTTFSKTIKPITSGQDKLKLAMETLLKGPTQAQKLNGIYSEIPSNTKLISVKEANGKIIINLSSDFQYGGGADSLYNRVKQIIKTSVANSNGKPVYLYLNGKQVNTIGGEGIMINQPLNERSLDD